MFQENLTFFPFFRHPYIPATPILHYENIPPQADIAGANEIMKNKSFIFFFLLFILFL